MTDFVSLLATIQQVRDATAIHLQSETNPDIRAGMEINLDLLSRALNDAGWQSGSAVEYCEHCNDPLDANDIDGARCTNCGTMIT